MYFKAIHWHCDEFRFHHNLICRSSKLAGCDAELNELRCKLSQFFKVLSKAGSQAERDLRGIERTSQSLGRLEKKFRSEYELTCNAGVPQPPQRTCHCKRGNINNLTSDIKNYYEEARQPYDNGRVQLDDLTSICDNLTLAIDSWTTELA